jgi:EmrB/QacA subfamily drug resistance transporter
MSSRRTGPPTEGGGAEGSDAAGATDGSDTHDPITDVAVEAPGVDEEPVVPWSMLLRRRGPGRGGERTGSGNAWFVTWTVLFGAFWVSSTITILAVSRPTIAEDLGASVESLVWLISGPTIAVALTGTTAGKLGDLHGHRRVYLIGMAGATVFVALTALAWSGPSLIAFRVLGATIGAATGPSSLAIINRMFTPERRSRALGFWSLVVAGGPVVGLVAGGPLVEAFGWRVIFAVQAPLLAAAMVVAFFVLPETGKQRDVHFDVRGQLWLVVTLGGLLIGIDRAAAWGIGNPWVLGCLALVPIGLAAFVRVERRAAHPLIPLEWFRRRSFAVPVSVSFFMQFGYMGGFILTPLLLEEVRDLDADVVALIMVPRPLTFAIAGPLAGYLVGRVTTRATIVAGTASLTLSMVVFALIATDPSTAIVVLALTLSGIGVGAAQPAIASSVANSVANADLGVAGATQQLVSQVGTTLGMNVLEAVQVVARRGEATGGSYAVAYGVGAAVTGVGLVLSLLMPRRRARADT